ncbi:MAG: helix-turn-helix transcriptional regulator [Clostridia bacterium]|nr:helix-turn-helix transcriptional regulator [Clostridia bacterium]
MITELKEMGLTQSMIAREMRVNRQTVNQWFTGERTPSARSVNKMAAAMSVLLGKPYPPAEAYTLIAKVTERKAKEKSENE